jgi:hypothetical protein
MRLDSSLTAVALNMPRIEYLLALVLVLSVFLWRRFVISGRLPLPPGPPRRFLTGNLHQLPTSQPWLTYAEWAKEFGSPFCVQIRGCFSSIFIQRQGLS